MKTSVSEVRQDIANLGNYLKETTARLNERIDVSNRRIDLANRRIDEAYGRMMALNPDLPPNPLAPSFGNTVPKTNG